VEVPQWRRAEIRQRSPVRLTFRIRSCEHYFDFAFNRLFILALSATLEPSERPFEQLLEWRLAVQGD
jgi:hypothetical protein